MAVAFKRHEGVNAFKLVDVCFTYACVLGKYFDIGYFELFLPISKWLIPPLASAFVIIKCLGELWLLLFISSSPLQLQKVKIHLHLVFYYYSVRDH